MRLRHDRRIPHLGHLALRQAGNSAPLLPRVTCVVPAGGIRLAGNSKGYCNEVAFHERGTLKPRVQGIKGPPLPFGRAKDYSIKSGNTATGRS